MPRVGSRESQAERKGARESAAQGPVLGAGRLPPLGCASSPSLLLQDLSRLQLSSTSTSTSTPTASSLNFGTPGTCGSSGSAASPSPWSEARLGLRSSLRSGGGVVRRRTDKSEKLQPLRQPGGGGANLAGLVTAPVWAPSRPLPSATLKAPAAREASQQQPGLEGCSDSVSPTARGAAAAGQKGGLSKASSTPSLGGAPSPVAAAHGRGAAVGYSASAAVPLQPRQHAR
eukprot:CAMPEP_0203908272 /NCGR_PEP_ID=MMETSP0359-20131031/49686_1 /ASSEMBLY_ACC=CAM_ASM_000338 /TAXON_ID=268821 /ORGANISM="Scrippsiella Hangoei, Strain SHTV-5" /LENGTH=229 /DNA_ID=CAMNT_0050833239 /DNA_START=84 /DNA_END=770 /DNA_ORIENTATION=-